MTANYTVLEPANQVLFSDSPWNQVRSLLVVTFCLDRYLSSDSPWNQVRSYKILPIVTSNHRYLSLHSVLILTYPSTPRGTSATAP